MKLLVACFLFGLYACANGNSSSIIPPARMEKVEKDLMKVDEFINNFLLKDSTLNIKERRSILYEKVFVLHNTTRQQFFSSYKYYLAHPGLQKVVFDSLYNDLNKRLDDTIIVGPGRKRNAI